MVQDRHSYNGILHCELEKGAVSSSWLLEMLANLNEGMLNLHI